MSDKQEGVEEERVHAITDQTYPVGIFQSKASLARCVTSSLAAPRGAFVSAEEFRRISPDYILLNAMKGLQENEKNAKLETQRERQRGEKSEKIMMEMKKTIIKMENQQANMSKELLAGKKNQIEISATVINLTKKCANLTKKCEDGKQIQSKMAEKIVNLTKDCEEGKQIQRKMSENMSEMRNKQVELEDLICDMRKDNGNIWAQHSSGNRAFGRRVSDVVQSAGERKARERELLSQKERTARGPLREKARKAREVTR